MPIANGERVTRDRLRDIAQQFQNWVKNRCREMGRPGSGCAGGAGATTLSIPTLSSQDRRGSGDSKSQGTGPDHDCHRRRRHRWHLQLAQRWIVQYNFYINDHHWGRMFVRICPYLPFSARVCLNQHHWLANRMQQKASILSNVPMHSCNCSDPRSCRNWQIP